MLENTGSLPLESLKQFTGKTSCFIQSFCIHLPLHICTTPVMMMTANTESLIPVNNICTRETQLTHRVLKTAIVTVNKILKIKKIKTRLSKAKANIALICQ